MKKEVGHYILVGLLILVPLFNGCSINSTKLVSSKSYDKYDLKVGDTWDVKVISDAPLERVVVTVTDDKTSAQNYLAKTEVQSKGFDRIITGHAKIDKENLGITELDATFVKDGVPIRLTQRSEYSHAGNPKFPMKVGKEWEVIETTTHRTMHGNEVSKKSSTKKFRYVVSGIDKISVEAGEFECLRVNKYEGDKLVAVHWYSPKTKFISVKEISYEKNELYKLQHYKVSW
ncbi:hypothetical protein [Zooshikella ganghwensis]|uniref:hypothetical protein n=1 Tax=Zooshikella ganghwensis TaxID=202772 RepID=UPI000421DF9A|nr:hypothetical protein [Zooshikella ganghwensis]